jgi:hypothetical protein
MERKKASDFPQELLNLFDGYLHGGISRRQFLDGAQKFGVVVAPPRPAGLLNADVSERAAEMVSGRQPPGTAIILDTQPHQSYYLGAGHRYSSDERGETAVSDVADLEPLLLCGLSTATGLSLAVAGPTVSGAEAEGFDLSEVRRPAAKRQRPGARLPLLAADRDFISDPALAFEMIGDPDFRSRLDGTPVRWGGSGTEHCVVRRLEGRIAKARLGREAPAAPIYPEDRTVSVHRRRCGIGCYRKANRNSGRPKRLMHQNLPHEGLVETGFLADTLRNGANELIIRYRQ